MKKKKHNKWILLVSLTGWVCGGFLRFSLLVTLVYIAHLYLHVHPVWYASIRQYSLVYFKTVFWLYYSLPCFLLVFLFGHHFTSLRQFSPALCITFMVDVYTSALFFSSPSSHVGDGVGDVSLGPYLLSGILWAERRKVRYGSGYFVSIKVWLDAFHPCGLLL